MSFLKSFKRKILSYYDRKNLLLVILLSAFIMFHLFLISQTFYIGGDGNIRSTITGYGDIPLHLTQVTKFAFENNFNLNEPIFYGQKLDYPFIINLISGLLLRFTGLFSFSFLFPSFVFASLNILLIFYIYNRFLKDRRLAFLSLLIFFLGSGIAGFEYLGDAIKKGLNFTQFITYFIQNHLTTVVRLDAKYPVQSIDFGAPLSLVLLHQRAFFLGMTGFMLFLATLLILEKNKSKKWIYISGISLGLLPMMHTHSFVAAVITIFSFLFISFIRKDFPFVKRILFTGILGFIISLPQLLFLLQPSTYVKDSFLVFRFGWMVPPTIGSVVFPPGVLPSALSIYYLQFLWLNFGVILPLFVISFLIILWKKEYFLKKGFLIFLSFSLASILLFLCGQLIRFQPWDFDDNKIFVYFQFFAVPVILLLLKEIALNKKYLGLTLIILFSFFSLFSGVLDMLPRIATPYNSLPVIFDPYTRETADYIKQNISQKDLILTGTYHRNPVDSLAGRPVIVGYPGWLWSRGINYLSRQNLLQNFYRNPSNDNPLLKEFPIKYVLLSNEDIIDMGVDKNLFDNKYPVVYQNPEFTLYKIK